MDEETEAQIKELRILEQTLQNLLMQKQAFQLEVNESENALEELEKSTGETFKIAGSIMIKYPKEKLIKELSEKKDMLGLRLKSLDTQESSLEQRAEDLRKNVLSKIKK